MGDQHEPDDDLSAALRRLPREMTPPSHVAASLSRSLARRRSAATVFRLAIAATLVVAAFSAGRFTASRSATPLPGQKFAFLLYGGAAGGGGDDRAAEYGAWAIDARRAGRSVSGERLADAAFVVGGALSEPAPLRGFFIVSATDTSDALELARRHPHAAVGTVIVRPIDTP
jgi:hypothetical protein